MAIYYCTKENNTCTKKEECTRYIESEGKDKATLFKMACVKENNYQLFIENKNKEGEA